MDPDGLLADEQPLADLPVRPPFGDERQDLALAARQPEGVLGGGRSLPDDPAKQPYATSFGDGSPIPEDFIALMHETYATHAVAVPYQPGDFIVVNNLVATHGRQPFTPPRRVLATLRERVFLTTNPAFIQHV